MRATVGAVKKPRPIASSFGSVVAFDGACVKFRSGKRRGDWVCETKPQRKQTNRFPRHPKKRS